MSQSSTPRRNRVLRVNELLTPHDIQTLPQIPSILDSPIVSPRSSAEGDNDIGHGFEVPNLASRSQDHSRERQPSRPTSPRAASPRQAQRLTLPPHIKGSSLSSALSTARAEGPAFPTQRAVRGPSAGPSTGPAHRLSPRATNPIIRHPVASMSNEAQKARQKKRGRPKKAPAQDAATGVNDAPMPTHSTNKEPVPAIAVVAARKRGRPPKKEKGKARENHGTDFRSRRGGHEVSSGRIQKPSSKSKGHHPLNAKKLFGDDGSTRRTHSMLLRGSTLGIEHGPDALLKGL